MEVNQNIFNLCLDCKKQNKKSVYSLFLGAEYCKEDMLDVKFHKKWPSNLVIVEMVEYI